MRRRVSSPNPFLISAKPPFSSFPGAFLLLILFVSPAVLGEETRTLAEWERIVIAEDLHWRTSGRGGREEWVEHLTALASKTGTDAKSESRIAAFKLGTFYLKMSHYTSHEEHLSAWRWFREAGGDDHALAQLALGYVFVSLAKEYDRRDHFDDVHDVLERMGEPAIAALERAAAREEDPAMKRAAARILHDVRKKMEGRK